MISIVNYEKCITGEHRFIETDIELSTEDVDELNMLFRNGTFFEKIIELETICSDLYRDLITYINTKNINRILSKKGADKLKIIRNSNKMLLAYCASIKMLIEKIESYIKHYCPKEDFRDFKKFCSKIYDENLSYRFVMRLRNYMIHCDLPFTIAKTSITDGCMLYFSREELLRGDVWSTVRDDIKRMPEEINVLPILSEIPKHIKKIVDESRYYYAPMVSDACQKIETFAIKHNTRSLIYVIYDPDKGITSGTICTPPMNALEKTVATIQQHPRVNVIYHVNRHICKTELIQIR